MERLLEERGWGATLAAAAPVRRPPGTVGDERAAALDHLWRDGPEPGIITQLLPPAVGAPAAPPGPAGAGVTSAALRLARR
ncbi:MAG: hypothetical protein ACRD01_07405, partial [Terriglobales bacterium]